MTKKKYYKWIEYEGGKSICKRGRFELVEISKEEFNKGIMEVKKEMNKVEKTELLVFIIYGVLMFVIGVLVGNIVLK